MLFELPNKKELPLHQQGYSNNTTMSHHKLQDFLDKLAKKEGYPERIEEAREGTSEK
jgi:hypothetical protein